MLGSSVRVREAQVNRTIKRLLITGSGRCGTKWIAQALRHAGVDCGHERAFNLDHHGEGNWIAESSWPAAPYLPSVGSETYVVHLVRHPLQVIASRAAWGTYPDDGARTMRSRRGEFAMKHCPAIRLGRDTLERSAIHWVEWNKLITNPDERLQVEKLGPEDVARLAAIITGRHGHTFPVPPPTVNTVGCDKLKMLTWPEIEHVPGVVDLARRYGYV